LWAEFFTVRGCGCAVYSMCQSALKETAFKNRWSPSALALIVQTALNLSVSWSEACYISAITLMIL